jgi:NurA-like 5'-3' nuclease
MRFIDEIRNMEINYVLKEEIKEKIRAEAKKDNKNYLIMLLSELKEYDVKALEKEGFTVTIVKKRELDCKNEYYDREYYKISW